MHTSIVNAFGPRQTRARWKWFLLSKLRWFGQIFTALDFPCRDGVMHLHPAPAGTRPSALRDVGLQLQPIPLHLCPRLLSLGLQLDPFDYFKINTPLI